MAGRTRRFQYGAFPSLHRSPFVGLVAIVACVAVLAAVAPASAQWIPDGTPVCTLPGPQDAPILVSDGAGGAIIAWQDGRNPSDRLGGDVYAQRLTPAGSISFGWTPNGVPVCTALGDESVLDMIPDGAGGAIIVWQDYREGSSTVKDIYAQRITASGAVAPGWPVNGVPICTAIHDQMYPSLCTDGAGGAIIAWEDPRNSSDALGQFENVYAQRVTGSGAIAPGWPPNGIPITTMRFNAVYPRIVADGSGGGIITWGEVNIFAERITGAGVLAPGWVANGNVVSSGLGSDPMIASDGAGGVFIAWQDHRNAGSGWDVYLQRVGGDGQASPGWPANGVRTCGAAGDQGGLGMFEGALGPPVVADGAGGAIVAWEDFRNGAEADIYAQRITAAGSVAPGWAADGAPVSLATDWQDVPELVADGSGGALVTWRDARSGTEYDIYAQHMTATGDVAPGWVTDGSAVCTAPGYQFTPNIAADGSGGAIIAWWDYRLDSVHFVNSDIYAQHVPLDTPVATLVSLEHAEVRDGEVRLTWFSELGNSIVATLYRSSGHEAWQTLETLSPDGTGRMNYIDHDVVPGGRYGYRLGIQNGGRQEIFGETWIEVPAIAQLALRVTSPNPSGRGVAVSFSLPSAESASLELFDLAARRIASREVGSSGAGSYVVTLGEGANLPPGIYLVRLNQGSKRLTTKAIVIR